MDDYWEPGKALLQDPGKFLEGLFKYDKVRAVFLNSAIKYLNILCTVQSVLIQFPSAYYTGQHS